MATVPLVDRPREKLARVGAMALGDNELVALVLGTGTRSRGALLVAQDVIALAGGVPGLLKMGLDELDRIPGVGTSRAARLLAAVELGRRTLFGDGDERPQMRTAKDLAGYLMPRYGGGAVERFGVVLLDQRRRVIRSVILSTGTAEASICHPRDVFRAAVLASASSVVVFHNHPSGDPMPSAADRVVTRQLVDAGELMSIDVIDHIILGATTYFSFKEESKR
ncbi:MAG TPA: DNA repair protein RadC [Vicinamibacterales bacterium]|nr:DNA repair protein RadC [Vicinamibacterales bacterium]